MRSWILAAAILLGISAPALATTGTWVVQDANGVVRTFDVVLDALGNFVPMYVVCDYVAAANCAAVDPATNALKVECVSGC